MENTENRAQAPVTTPPPAVASPTYAPQVVYADSKNGMAVASLVLGILAIIAPYLGVFFGILAVIFGAVYLHSKRLASRGLAIAGVITGGIGALLWFAALGFLIFALFLSSGSYNSYSGQSSDAAQRTAANKVVRGVEVYYAQKGTRPTVDMLNNAGFQASYGLQGIVNPDTGEAYHFTSSTPTEYTIGYTTGSSCSGDTAPDAYAVRTLLYSGEVLCLPETSSSNSSYNTQYN